MLGPWCDGRREAAPVGITGCPCWMEGFIPGILSCACFSTGQTPLRRPLPTSRRSRADLGSQVPSSPARGGEPGDQTDRGPRPRSAWWLEGGEFPLPPTPHGPEELGFPPKQCVAVAGRVMQL